MELQRIPEHRGLGQAELVERLPDDGGRGLAEGGFACGEPPSGLDARDGALHQQALAGESHTGVTRTLITGCFTHQNLPGVRVEVLGQPSDALCRRVLRRLVDAALHPGIEKVWLVEWHETNQLAGDGETGLGHSESFDWSAFSLGWLVRQGRF